MTIIPNFLANKIKEVINHGGIIAYPTESVYGLGCDPFNEQAVKKIFSLKGREENKGLILIASSWHQINELVAPSGNFELALSTWPGPVTWLFQCSEKVPVWLNGNKNTIALRITAHPMASAICEMLDKAIVSTSANLAGEKPARTAAEVYQIFGDAIDLIIEGEVGDLKQPTPIRDVQTGNYLRY